MMLNLDFLHQRIIPLAPLRVAMTSAGARPMNIHIIINCNSEDLSRSVNQSLFEECKEANGTVFLRFLQGISAASRLRVQR